MAQSTTRQEVITYYLEQNSLDELNEKVLNRDITVVECEIKQYQLNKFLYQFVGGAWQWFDKLSWTDQQWQDLVNSERHKTWVAYNKGAIAGYYELEIQEKGDVEILYFGLAPQFIGQGFGGGLLSHAVKSAWHLPRTRRVWVHTCTLDHPVALKNYKSRGFKVYQEDFEEV